MAYTGGIKVVYASGSPLFGTYGSTPRYLAAGTVINGSDGPFASIDVKHGIKPDDNISGAYAMVGNAGYPYGVVGIDSQSDDTMNTLTIYCNDASNECVINGSLRAFAGARVVVKNKLWTGDSVGSRGTSSRLRVGGLRASGPGACFSTQFVDNVTCTGAVWVDFHAFSAIGSYWGVFDLSSTIISQRAGHLDLRGFIYQHSSGGSVGNYVVWIEDDNVLLGEGLGVLTGLAADSLLTPANGYTNGGDFVGWLIDLQSSSHQGIGLFGKGRSRLGGSTGAVKITGPNMATVRAVSVGQLSYVAVQLDTNMPDCWLNAAGLSAIDFGVQPSTTYPPAWKFTADYNSAIGWLPSGATASQWLAGLENGTQVAVRANSRGELCAPSDPLIAGTITVR